VQALPELTTALSGFMTTALSGCAKTALSGFMTTALSGCAKTALSGFLAPALSDFAHKIQPVNKNSLD